MAPRAYRMTRRAAASAETRRRIVDAAIALHAEKGVLGATWPDIAKRADVALGTVYRYFPSLDQLVPACTSENAVRMRPPGVTVLEGLTRPEERIGRFVQELFAFYGRSAPWAARGAGPYRLRRLAVANSLRTLDRGGCPTGHRGSRDLVEATIINSLGGFKKWPTCWKSLTVSSGSR